MTGKMIDVGREVKSRDYSAETKDNKPVYKTRVVFPSLTVVGKPELGQLKYGEEVTIQVTLRATGFGERRDWECCDGDEKKIPEATFDILKMEVPEDAIPVKQIPVTKVAVKSSKMKNPIDTIGMDDENPEEEAAADEEAD